MVWPTEVVDKLIDLVSKHPLLYDHSDPDYYDKDKVDNSWSAIGQELCKRGSQVRALWKHLTKMYIWIRNNEYYKLDDGCYWPYLEKLEFLKPYVGNFAVVMNTSCGEELIDLEASKESGVPVAAFITYKSSAADQDQENLDTSITPDNKILSRPQSPFVPQDKKVFLNRSMDSPFPASLNGLAMQKNLEIEEALCQYLRKKVSKEKDHNELFLTSVAHDMKMLSAQNQAVFKMKVQQLLVEMISNTKGDVK